MKEKTEQREEPAKEAPEAQVPDSMWPLWVKSTAGFIFETLKIVIISLVFFDSAVLREGRVHGTVFPRLSVFAY